MSSRPLPSFHTVLWVCVAACLPALRAQAQPWQMEQVVDIGSFDSTARVSLAIAGDVLALGVGTATGGHVEVRGRHQGGLDQWGLLGFVDSSQPWFGHAVALRTGRLAVGAPGASAFTGAVHLYGVEPSDLFEPLIDLGELPAPPLLAGYRFGYSLLWIGDTLAVGAVARPAFRTNGAVFLFDASDEPVLLGELPQEPARVQIPFQRWFGASLAQAGDLLAVAAPFTGFRDDLPNQQVGCIQLYRKEPQAASGWALDTVLFDVEPQDNPCQFFKRVELGRSGLAFVDGRLVVDHALAYSGTEGDALEPWRAHVSDTTGCTECALRVLAPQAGVWNMEGSAATGQEPALRRSIAGWSAYGDRLFVNWYDPLAQIWGTATHRRDMGGPDGWGVETVLPEADVCDILTGPMAAGPNVLVRASMRRSSACGVDIGMIGVQVQVFRE